MNFERPPSPRSPEQERMLQLGRKCLLALSIMAALGGRADAQATMRKMLHGDMPTPHHIESILFDHGSRRMAKAARKIRERSRGQHDEKQLGELDTEEDIPKEIAA